MLGRSFQRLLIVSSEKLKSVLDDIIHEKSTEIQPDFYLLLGQYRYSLRTEYAYAIGNYLKVNFEDIKLSIGLADPSQTKGVHKRLGVTLPEVPRSHLKSLRDAIDSKKVREFIELHFVATKDAHKKGLEEQNTEREWKSAVQNVVTTISSMNPLVIIHHSKLSQNDAKYMKSVSVKYHHEPAVVDLHNDLPNILEKARVVEIPKPPSRVRQEMESLITSESPDWLDVTSNDALFRMSLLNDLYPGVLWNSAYFLHNGACLGCRQQFDYLYQTQQMGRMLMNPNATMYGGLRYTRKNAFTRGKKIIGHKKSRPKSNVTSLKNPLG